MEAILKRHIKDCFRINGKQSKILKEFADFESTLVLENFECKIHINVIQTNIKNMLPAFMTEI